MTTAPLTPFLPARINTGPWLAGYSLSALKARANTDRMVLPICPLGTPPEQLAALAPLVLPPLYREALDDDLKAALLAQIRRCFPYYEGTRNRANFRGTFDIVELPAVRHAPPVARPPILAFSVDTAVEQHGPHLPLATDTLESYAVLHQLAAENPGFVLGPPIDYGHLTWGLPFGLSIDLTPALTRRYVRGVVDALLDWIQPEALYVVDVHGSLAHRHAIQEGLRDSRCTRWLFRWLFEPLGPFAAPRGDQHAGGIETALVARISPALVDPAWWPDRLDALAAHQMAMDRAIELSPRLDQFVAQAEARDWNGIVGDIRAFHDLDADVLFGCMLEVGRRDVHTLRTGHTP